VKLLSHRRLAAIFVAGLAIAVLPSGSAPKASPVHVDARPAASSGWLDRFNTWRANAGQPALTEDATYSSGDYLHAVYMVQTGQITHSESTAYSQYTVAGDTAAQNSNLFVSGSTGTTDEQAIDWWMGAPFHAMAMMDPRLSSTGFGSYRNSAYSPWQMGAAVNVSQGNSQALGMYTNPVFFPGNGATEPLTAYSGNESPNPQSACPGYSGLPLFIEIGGNVDTVAGAHTLTGNGSLLATCAIDSSNTSFTSNLKWHGGVIVMPQAPLQSGVTYVVALTVNSVPYTWSFKVGAFLAVSGVTPDAGIAAGGTAVTITGAGFTGASSVKFGATAATSFAVVSDTTITAVSPAHVVGPVDITVTTPAGITPTVAADQFNFATPCTAVTASAAPASPQVSGATITVTAVGTCPSANPQYEFWAKWAGTSSWILQRAYSTSPTWTWNSTGAPPGTESFGVWVRDANSLGVGTSTMGRFDAIAGVSYTLVSSGIACTSVSLSSAPASPQNSGATITVTATATCPNANPKFQFVALWAGTGSWIVQQPYSTTATWTWASTGAPAGTELFGVWVKDAGSTSTYDAVASTPYTLTTQACTAVNATVAPGASAPSGTTITVTATSTCPNANQRYEFWAMWAGTSGWILQRAYSTSPTWTWNTTGAPPGTEHFGVWVRDASSAAAYDRYASISFTVT
jgi:hypothetical protein